MVKELLTSAAASSTQRMTGVERDMAEPEADVDRLAKIAPEVPILSFMASCEGKSASRAALEKAVGRLYPASLEFGTIIDRLVGEKKIIAQSRGRRLRLAKAAAERVNGILGDIGAEASWPAICQRRLVAIALGLDPNCARVRSYLARKENLESKALGCLYDVAEADHLPTRNQVRFALLRAFVTARIPECETAFMEIPMQNTSRDVIGRAVMLGASGLKSGTMRDAEAALLGKALNLGTDSKQELVDALIRASLGKNAPRLPARIRVEVENKKQDLTEFAATVRDLAKTQKTAPYAGRVAIAQVYDIGITRGLNFGSLDEFKIKVVSACRAGLLDLERYDIAGPMDSALRERSRTAFGRDERHFIVNEWI